MPRSCETITNRVPNVPSADAEKVLLATLTDINAAITKGCAKCSYHLWRVYGSQSGGYNYLWTCSWPGGDVYIKVHQSGDYQVAINGTRMIKRHLGYRRGYEDVSLQPVRRSE